jgi:protein-tyrosine phosphatase
VIDLHCHLLPALDDGALDAADSVEMARTAARDGLVAVCATPHIRDDHDVRIAELPRRRDALQARLDAEGVGVAVLPGGEVAETIADGLTDDELRAVSLGGGGRWILVEPRPGPLSPELTMALERLAGRGFRAVVAHPERHAGPGLLARLAAAIDLGALVQVTAAHVVSGHAAPTLLDLARRGLLHVVASDAHSSRGGRPLRVTPALDRLADVPELAPHLAWIARTAPEAIVAGRDVEPPYRPIA